MIILDSDIMMKVFTPVLFLSLCSGILLLGSFLYLFVYIFEKKRLFLTILILGLLGFIFTFSDVLVIMLSITNNIETAFFFHRIEAVSALFFCFALPMLLSDLLELGKNFRKFNTILFKIILAVSFVMLLITIISPDLFISPVKPSGVLTTPWNTGRGTPGILYRIRDVLIFSSTIYTFLSIIIDIIKNRRIRYLGLILAGIVIGIISGAFDIVQGIIEMENGLFSSRIYSNFGFGFTVFILLSMISVLRWFLDQARDIDNAKKIESLGLFAGGIAHDFNNILTGIMGNTSLLIHNSHSSNPDNEILTDIEKAVYRAKNLTMQLLTFSRGGTPVKDITSIKNIVEETARFVLTGSGIKPRIISDHDLLNIEADSGQISQVIQNLVLNARDAMTEKIGFIDIRMENTRMLPPAVKNPKVSDFIKIEIKDYGEGINERIIPYIFDPYFTTKGLGTGLGLSVCHSIIRKHGGEITVKSKAGEGTTFTVFLPATAKKEIFSTAHNTEKFSFSGTVLIMDDDPFLLPMIKKMLEHIGMTAVCVPDGETALEEFKKSKSTNNTFQLILMDLTVSGGMGGVKTAKRIHEIDQSVPIIVSSGYSDDPVMSDFKSYGFSGKISKPFTLDELRKTISVILSSSQPL